MKLALYTYAQTANSLKQINILLSCALRISCKDNYDNLVIVCDACTLCIRIGFDCEAHIYRASAWILYAEFQLTFVRLPYRVYLQPNTFGLTHTFSISGHQAALDKIDQIFFVSSLMILSISFIDIF